MKVFAVMEVGTHFIRNAEVERQRRILRIRAEASRNIHI